MNVLLLLLAVQHQHHAEPATQGLLALSAARTGSGTTWLPDDAPVPGYHWRAGGWDVMVHGSVFVQYDRVTGTRADGQAGSTNWLMAMASRTTARQSLRLRLMLTAEPFTLSRPGYPQLLQVAHPYKGAPAPDRQHPHELIPELSAAYEHALGDGLAVSLYAAPVGEPALGPVAYNHRPSAAYDPTAPLGHVAQDYAHESLGVVTLGVFTRRARIEASAFNGSHPDDRHANFDLQGGRLTSYAGRITVGGARLAAAAWLGYVSPETAPGHAHGALHKVGASLLHSAARRHALGSWSTTLVWGANRPQGGPALHTVLVESALDLTAHHGVSARVEYVQRTADELALTGSVPDEQDVGAASLGYAWRTSVGGHATAALGVHGTVSFVPAALTPFYGGRTPVSFLVYVRFGPPLR